MLRTVTALLAGCSFAACSPTFNWREVRVEPTALRAMLPCKPDKAARQVPMAGRQVSLEVLGCDAGGNTFAVLYADIGDPQLAAEALNRWKLASLSNMRGAQPKEKAFVPAGALPLPQSVQVDASGQLPDGGKVQSRAAYFSHGRHVFQAVVYAKQIEPDVAEPFFSGLKFQ